MSATYVYGLVGADARLPEDLKGLGPSGRVSTIAHGEVAAIVGDVPVDRPIGTRDDLLAHEAVVDAVAATTAVLPMRFPAVVESDGVVEELIAPHHDHFVDVLDALDGKVQFTLKGRYEQDVVLAELVEEDPEIRALQEKVRELPGWASSWSRRWRSGATTRASGSCSGWSRSRPRSWPTGPASRTTWSTRRSSSNGPASASSRTPWRTRAATSPAGCGCGCSARSRPTTSSRRDELGLLTGLLGLPLAPVRGVVWLAEQIRDQAEEQYYDPARIRAELDRVDEGRRSGELTEEEAAELENELLQRLMAGRRSPGVGGDRGG